MYRKSVIITEKSKDIQLAHVKMYNYALHFCTMHLLTSLDLWATQKKTLLYNYFSLLLVLVLIHHYYNNSMTHLL